MIIRLLGVLLVVATAAAVLFAGLWLRNTVPTDSMPNWITAIATLIALVLAAFAAWGTFGQLSVLRNEAEARAADDRSRQARLIYWSEEDGFRWYNVSNEPVMNVSIFIQAPGEDACEMFFADLHPTDREGQIVPIVAQYFEAISSRWTGREYTTSTGSGAWGPHAYTASMVFTDSAGRRWERNSLLELVEVPASGPSGASVGLGFTDGDLVGSLPVPIDLAGLLNQPSTSRSVVPIFVRPLRPITLRAPTRSDTSGTT